MLRVYLDGYVVLLLFGALAISSAQTLHDNEPECDVKSPRKVEIASGDTTILGFTIGHSSLKDIQLKLGRASVIRASKEEESDVSICYISPTDGTVLAFYSGPMGGWTDMTWFALWSREAEFAGRSRCAHSELVSHNLATASGIHLGLTKAELEKIEGTPTRATSTRYIYDYLCRRKMTEEEIEGFKTANNWDVNKDPYFDRGSWLHAWYAGTRISRIEVGEIESY